MVNQYGQSHIEIHQQQTFLSVPTVMAPYDLNCRLALTMIMYMSIATYH